MKTCPFCKKSISDDAKFCTYCGKEVTEVSKSKEIELKDNPRKNLWAILGMVIFLVNMVLNDFILGYILASLEMNYKFVYIVSAVIYVIAIGCSVISMIVDHKDKKKGYKPSGNLGVSVGLVAVSIYIICSNLMHVL